MRISDWSSDVCSSDLRALAPADELHVVDHQDVNRAELLLERHRVAKPNGPDELVHELLGRQVDDATARVALADMPRDRMHQMGLAEPYAPVQKERIERHASGLGSPAARRMGELVRLAGDEIVEREALVRSEEHTSELQSLMRISYAVFCLKQK